MATSTPNRIIVKDQSDAESGVRVSHVICPITGEAVPVVVSRFLPAGTILFNAEYGDDGKPVLEVDVLPQVQLPELAAGQNVYGYTIQELAPTHASPQVFKWLISCYATLKLKNAVAVAKSTGVTAVS